MIARLMASAMALTGVAYAQNPPAGNADADCAPTPLCAGATVTNGADRVAYEVAFFAQFNPQTALDIVRQTPGFSLSGGDDRRGFSGAVGNLLIDGLRPSAKNQSIETILSQIPAAQVVRVEVLRGAATAGDASGRSVLLNVVRTPSVHSGVWGVGAEIIADHDVSPRGNIAYSGRSGQIEYGVGGSYYSNNRSLDGWRRVTDGAGALVETVDTPSPRAFREASINGNIAFPVAGGRFSATTEISGFDFDSDSGFHFFRPDGSNRLNLLVDYAEQRLGYEVGLNYDRAIGPWALELVGLLNRARYEADELAATSDGAGAPLSLLTQGRVRDSGETILRGALARPLGGTHRIEFGLEGAFNFLDAELALIEDTGAGPTPIIIPNANVLVEEERAEVFAVHTWRPSDRWSVESRLAWETSTLTFTGDANQVVELSYWKPSFQVTRTIGESNQLRARAYRDVGQLDFDDFVSAASIADALIAGGNPDLTPQTSWRAEIGADFRFRGAALGLTLTRHWIEDVADLVLITAPGPNPGDPPILFDAPGNIGDGDALSLDVTFNTPLDPIIPGGRLTIRGYLWDTEVTDPVTGAGRIISYRPESQISIEFRQNFPSLRLAWGFNAFKEGEFQAYRFNEIDTNEEGPWVDVFVETTALPNNMRLRLWAANAFNGTINRERLMFAPDRTGPLVRRDLRERQFANAPWAIIQLSGTF